MKKRVLSLLLACFMIFSLVACGNAKETSDAEESVDAEEKVDAEDSSESIKIGQIGPTSGPAAVYGISTLQGVKLAISEINEAGGVLGRQIELIAEDDKHDASEAVTIYNKLMDLKVDAIIGAVTSGPADAVATNSIDDGVPIITPTGTMASITEGKTNVFRTCYTDPYQGEALATYIAKNLGAKTAAVLRNTSIDYSNGVADAFIKLAEELGVEIVADEGYSTDAVDFSPQLTNIQQKNPEVLLVPEYYETDVLIAKQVSDLGLDVQIVGPDGWDGVLDVVDADSLDTLEGVFFANHYSKDDDSEVVKSFLENYRAEYDEDPLSFAALGYDSVYLLKAAWEDAKSTDYEAVSEALSAVENAGVTGNLVFGENNNPIKSATIITITNGEYKYHDIVSVK